MECAVSFVLFSLATSTTLLTRGPRVLQKIKLLRGLSAITAGSLMTYLMDKQIFKPTLLNDLEHWGLAEKYLQLDLNADLMRADLQKMGIEIKAKYFDYDEI